VFVAIGYTRRGEPSLCLGAPDPPGANERY
jgi:hypothetical protein